MIKFRIKAITLTEVLSSGQDNEERVKEVDEEEEEEIEYWDKEEWGEEWEQWEFVGEDDVKEDQEYEEDEEEEEDEEDDNEKKEEEEGKEEDKGEGEGASVPTDLCKVCVTRPRNASFIHGDTGHQVFCFEYTSKVEKSKRQMSSQGKL